MATTAAITNKGVYVGHASEAMRPVTMLGLVSAAFLSAFGFTHQLVGVTQQNRLDRDPGKKGACKREIISVQVLEISC